MYAFLYPKPEIKDGKQWCHVFKCFAKHCKGKGKEPCLIRHYLDTGNQNFTGSLHKHAKACWGEDAVQQVDKTKNLMHAHEAVKKAQKAGPLNGSIMAFFSRGETKGEVKYLHCQHTEAETRYVHPYLHANGLTC